MKKKGKEILNLLLNNKNKDLDIYLKILNLKKRTFQYYLKDINFWLIKENLKTVHIKNNIIIFDEESIKKICKIKKYDTLNEIDIRDIIFLNAIFSEKGLNISKLSESLYISRNTLKKYIKKIEEEYYLEFFDGKFINVEIKLMSKILNNIILNKNINYYINEIIDIERIENIKNFILKISEKIDLKLNELAYFNLISYIYVFFITENNEINTFTNSFEFKIIKQIYDEFFEDKKALNPISDLIIGISLIPDIETWINESYYIAKLINNISLKINFDLTKDEVLYNFLLTHLKVSIYRMKKNIVLSDMYVQDLVIDNDYIIKVIKESIREIENVYSIRFDEVEITLLSYHINASLERTKKANIKKVILVCELGYGTSRVLEYNLNDNFELNILEVCPRHLLKEKIKLYKNIDYVLTTIDLKEEINSIKISPILNDDDFKKLLSLGFKIKKRKIYIDELLTDLKNEFNIYDEKLKDYLLEKYKGIFYTSKPNFINILSSINKNKVKFIDNIDSFESAVKEVGNILVNNNSCNKEYINIMLENILKYGSYMIVEEGVAIPHANSKENVYKTDFAFLILKNPVKLNAKEAKIFFAYCSVDNNSHLGFLKELYNIILNENFINDIDKITKYEDFIKYITKDKENDNVI
ncbi:BglG family transcription antiterminator [Oceanivirga salmonicida]|uniref:BglG family transcription antiterminator n=1 Tax=Oceanivirga salmonicida TaxID=1769291 RepID=UPI0012E12DBF|nr:PTS sugar transporter subunit IIA [Oceanivirga salmonicida]